MTELKHRRRPFWKRAFSMLRCLLGIHRWRYSGKDALGRPIERRCLRCGHEEERLYNSYAKSAFTRRWYDYSRGASLRDRIDSGLQALRHMWAIVENNRADCPIRECERCAIMDCPFGEPSSLSSRWLPGVLVGRALQAVRPRHAPSSRGSQWRRPHDADVALRLMWVYRHSAEKRMRERFEAWQPTTRSTLTRLKHCIEIVEEYRAQALRLTLRQLYYQFVTRGLIENTQRNYKNLGKLVSRARLAGYIDWDAIEDRGRKPDTPTEFADLDELVDAALSSYRLPRWQGQDCYAELWVEKLALASVLEPMARRLHVTLMVNRGYSSQSAMYEAAKRFKEAYRVRPIDECIVFYLGDHDPSGQDMVRDIRDRLEMFTHGDVPIDVRCIALTTEQVEEYDPPPNWAKVTDSRAKAYIERHGGNCWELDALEPTVLQQIVRIALESVIDADVMNEVIEREQVDRRRLSDALASLHLDEET